MRVTIAGGGTGGHLYPGIAVAEELVARGHQVRFVGTARGIEARACPQAGFAVDFIEVGGLKGQGLGGTLRGIGRVPRALFQSRALLKKYPADLVLGVGGYASGPFVLAAALRGIPTAILEQNSMPGLTNRLLGRVVKTVFGAWQGAARFFARKKWQLMGNPVRKKIREKLSGVRRGAATAAPHILVVGGSQGAHAVNELVAAAFPLLAARLAGVTLTHQTGPGDVAAMQQKYDGRPAAEVVMFIDDMASAYARADLVVARAGASTLAELTLLGMPSVLIPFPFAADDHQTENARELDAAGAARLMPQATTTPEALAELLASLLSDAAERARMSAAALQLAQPLAHARITEALEKLAHGTVDT